MSSSKTNLGLNVWSADDKPVREELNSDNKIIDQKLRDLDSKKANLAGATFTGEVHAQRLYAQNLSTGAPNEGGRVVLRKAVNSALTADVVIDNHLEYIRLRENGGELRGAQLKLDECKAGIGSRIWHSSANSIPYADATYDLGAGSKRMRNIYASAGTINTSDAREKEDVVALDADQMLAFLKALNPVRYKLINGTSGRPHYGLIAQEVEQAMARCGMEDFAGFIKSPVEDDEGNPTGEVAYGLRYDEFIAVLVKVNQLQEERLAAIEQRLEAAGL